MVLSADQLSDPIGWSTLLHGAGRKYELDVEASTGDICNSVSFLKEKMVMFAIKDKASPEQLLSFKTRVRGFLKVLAQACIRVAEHFNVEVYVASVDGQQRNEVINRTLRPATPEERAAGKPQFVVDREPLNPEELWEEFERTKPEVATGSARGHPRHVTVAFRETF